MYVLEIGQILVSRYRATTTFKIFHYQYRIFRVHLRLIQYIDIVSKHNDLYNREY